MEVIEPTAHLDSTVVLSRDIASLGIYPAVDPLDSTSRQLDPLVVGQDHYETARRDNTTVESKCAKVVAGDGSVKSSAGT